MPSQLFPITMHDASEASPPRAEASRLFRYPQVFGWMCESASAGGLEAFKTFLTAAPGDTGMAFVLVQHLDPDHESMMVDLLSRYTNMSVVQVTDAMDVRPNQVYMIPPGKYQKLSNWQRIKVLKSVTSCSPIATTIISMASTGFSRTMMPRYTCCMTRQNSGAVQIP